VSTARHFLIGKERRGSNLRQWQGIEASASDAIGIQPSHAAQNADIDRQIAAESKLLAEKGIAAELCYRNDEETPGFRLVEPNDYLKPS
jgi:hypothetical protein